MRHINHINKFHPVGLGDPEYFQKQLDSTINEINEISYILEDENIGFVIEKKSPFIVVNLFNRDGVKLSEKPHYLEFLDRLQEICKSNNKRYYTYPNREDIIIISKN